MGTPGWMDWPKYTWTMKKTLVNDATNGEYVLYESNIAYAEDKSGIYEEDPWVDVSASIRFNPETSATIITADGLASNPIYGLFERD